MASEVRSQCDHPPAPEGTAGLRGRACVVEVGRPGPRAEIASEHGASSPGRAGGPASRDSGQDVARSGATPTSVDEVGSPGEPVGGPGGRTPESLSPVIAALPVPVSPHRTRRPDSIPPRPPTVRRRGSGHRRSSRRSP